MRKNKNLKKFIIASFTALTVLSAPAILQTAGLQVSAEIFGIEAFAATVDYENLRQMLTDGNTTVKYNNYYTNLSNVESQLAVLKEECHNMVAYSKLDTESTTLTSEEYKNTASNLNRTINQLEKQLKKLTGSNASINTTLDMLEMQAQASLTSYLSAEANAAAAEKTAAAAEVKYNNQLSRQAAGMSTEADVTEVHGAMLSAQTQALALRQQADSLRRSLLQMLGITDDGSVEFAKVQLPDLNEIAAIDHDADLEKAINNDSSVQSVRHQRSDGTATMTVKSAAEEEAVGNATSDYNEAYTLLQTRVQDYNAAIGAMAAAETSYQGALRKKNAGMLTEADWLTAEASYIQNTASFDTACMNLRAAYENYKWLVKGVA